MVYDVIIVGAGVVGGMLARELSRYALSVCLLEKEHDVACGASRANSGIVHGGFDPVPGTLKARLNTAGVPKLYRAAAELNVPCRNNGALVVAFGAAEEPALTELYERGMRNGIADLTLLTGEEARQKEPALSPAVTAALYCPSSGIVCPYELTLAAVGNAMDNGAALLCDFEVTAVKRADTFTVTAADGRQVTGRYLVNCAGGGSGAVAALAGDPCFEIVPRAGEYYLLDKTEGTRVSHTVFQVPSREGKGVLVSPTVDGNLLVGPTATAVASADSTETTEAGLGTVRRLAAKSVPEVAFSRVITSFCGVRATGSGDDFVLCASKTVPGLIHAGGVDSPGLTACVAIAEYLTELLRQSGLLLTPRTDFVAVREDPHAFRHMTDTEKDAYIREHPAYGRVVCRCEGVSEGEIRAAIRRNPPARDTDGVKRRTRSGMGRCQGGFCLPTVMQLIAEETGMDITDVTKSGGDSRLLIKEEA